MFCWCLDQQQSNANDPSILKDFFFRNVFHFSLYINCELILLTIAWKTCAKLNAQPENIHNKHAKAFLLGQALKQKVISHRGGKNPCYTQDGNGPKFNVIDCIAADGRVIPPMYI